MHLVLDITLTVAKPWLQQPSGIDRVEFAHTRHWRGLPASDVTFVMRNGWNRLAAIPDGIARAMLEEADRRIAPGMTGRWGLRARSGALMYAQWWGLGRGLLRRRLAARPDSVFLTVSCATLHMQPALADLRAQGCRVVPLIHDVIPLTHPQYFPAKEPPRHARRIEALARLSDAGLIVSDAALDALRAHAARARLALPPMTVTRPGLDLPAAAPAAPARDGDPYFVMLGSLEPRKNHLLMLQLWQGMARQPGTPRLVILGRRPSAPHLATIMLDRTDFAGRVEDRGRLPDAEVASLLRGARALLFPSITEGFGIPLAEALAARVPVIASDIPAFRELGGPVPDYLDPLDGAGWRQAVLDYADPASPRRAAQLARLDSWQAPSWASHFEAAEALLRDVAARPVASLVAAPDRSMASPAAT
ncbi:MAG: glycosyltransferase family 4 protein [Acetobacteraceae bacterium]|nr:glycosyltransferase family 4 protein [Acetobacteraceae bacterium]